MQVKHFLLTGSGEIQEFSLDQALHVTLGHHPLPEYAGLEARYLQVTVGDPDESNTLSVRTAGSHVRFDEQGHLSEIGKLFGDRSLSRFEHDTCIQLALRDTLEDGAVTH